MGFRVERSEIGCLGFRVYDLGLKWIRLRGDIGDVWGRHRVYVGFRGLGFGLWGPRVWVWGLLVYKGTHVPTRETLLDLEVQHLPSWFCIMSSRECDLRSGLGAGSHAWVGV